MSIEALIKELRAHASWRAENQGPFTKENLLEWRAADRLASIQADNLRLKAALDEADVVAAYAAKAIRLTPAALRQLANDADAFLAARSLSPAGEGEL
ncbi:hypothetical protein [Mesorhizobium sp. B2-1-2]|uniref:hypothetical protein n=1 Tax=Mesorhizobium sp. B2-1-2 TaxID=2589973 RepID=UPI00112D1567|nr:hypothetical protein [Mesorhizobium sp. B2-1-2]TPN11667.1 hypothetical protein FJ971_09675 [Mesorhizobium sp. B2-1-2]